MPRSVWSGSISFGLVNIPVKVYGATSSKDVHFNQLHEPDGGRIRYKKTCAVEGEEVPSEEIVKGYKVGPDRYVVVDEEELEALEPKKSRAIQIEDFVDIAEIDPVYYDKPYYLAPDEASGRSYKLLLRAMRNSNKIAIGRVVMRAKEHLVAIRPKDGVLIMSTMLFPDEVVPQEQVGIELPETEPEEREVRMAEQLVETLAAPFHPDKYHDEHRERVLDYLEKKAAGQEFVQPPAPAAPKTVDLVSALEESLRAAKESRKEKPAEA